MPRPELGTPKVGDPIIVFYGNHSKRMTRSEMVVTKIGRAWLTANTPSGIERGWTHGARRFRLDTQRDESSHGYGNYFRTPEQQAWHSEVEAAEVYLREVAGLDIRREGPFYHDRDLVVSLAKLLKDAEASWRPS